MNRSLLSMKDRAPESFSYDRDSRRSNRPRCWICIIAAVNVRIVHGYDVLRGLMGRLLPLGPRDRCSSLRSIHVCSSNGEESCDVRMVDDNLWYHHATPWLRNDQWHGRDDAGLDTLRHRNDLRRRRDALQRI